MAKRAQELDRLSETGRTAFAGLIDTLGPIRARGSGLRERLEQIAEACAADGAQEPASLKGPIGATRAAFEAVIDGDRARELRQAVFGARAHLHEIRRKGVYLHAVASMTRTTAVSMGLSTFDTYAETLRTIASALIEGAERVLARLDDVSSREAAKLAAVAGAVDLLADLEAAIDVAEGTGAVLAERAQEVYAQAQSAAAKIAGDTQADLVGLIGLIQFSDEMSQRLDHAARIAAEPALPALLAAQIDALAEDLDRVLTEAAGRLGRLRGLADRALSQFDRSGIAGSAAGTLAQRRAAIDLALGRSERVNRAAAAAADSARAMETALGEASGSFATLRENAAAVTLSAINSALLAKRSSGANGALQTLSTAVRSAATECLAALDASTEQLEAVDRLNASYSDRVGKAASDLAAALDRAREALADKERAVEALRQTAADGHDTASELTAQIDAAERGLGPLGTLPDKLRRFATQAAIGAPEPDAERAAAVFAVYTMDRERAVHRAALGLPGQPVVEASTADLDLDSVLF